MKREPQPTYIELTFSDDARAPVEAGAPLGDETWFDEKTVRFDFDKPNLTAEDRLVIGYLTMEQNDLFGHLSVEEQQQIVRALKR